jgi:hypothetical protein
VIPGDLELGLPVFFGDIVFLPIVRQIRVRTPGLLSAAVSPVALFIDDGRKAGLALLDDGMSQEEVVLWLKGKGILV